MNNQPRQASQVLGHAPDASTPVDPEVNGRKGSADWRELLRDVALRNALQKRAAGVPTYTVPEAAALLSISQEYLYRLVKADAFPAVQMRLGTNQGRYVIPAKAVELLLDHAAETGSRVELGDWSEQWRAATGGGAA